MNFMKYIFGYSVRFRISGNPVRTLMPIVKKHIKAIYKMMSKSDNFLSIHI